jgi:hypothetical protein
LHFCNELAQTFEFYIGDTDRYFECEVEDVLPIDYRPGVIEKRVARRIKLTKEISIGTGNSNTGYRNTGNYNTGDYNTGYRNTGDYNTGDYNTGNYNTGNSNTGDYNTGCRNAGNSNTGDYNTGCRNTGNRNTGNCNTGNCNTGNSNAGYRNTGDYNATNFSAGFFNSIEPKVDCFDLPTQYTKNELQELCGHLINGLGSLLMQDDPISVDDFIEIPNISQEKLDKLHVKLIEARKQGS